MRQSIWERDVEFPSFPKLEGDIKTDVLVIGGGLCGVLCAWFLKQAGVDYVLVEGDAVGRGVTCNTTAKITSQHGLIYEKLLRTQGKEKALQYLDANQWALGKYRELAEETECDFEEKDAFVYTLTDWQKIEREVQALETLGFPAEFVQEVNLPFDTEGAVKFPRQAQFQPRRFLAYISRDLNIYEHTFIQELAPGCARYDGGTITARRMIAATHFPFLNKHGAYFLKLYQHRSYVMALKNVSDVRGMYVDEAQKGMSFRNYKDYLLVGGGSHRTGRKGGGRLGRASGVCTGVLWYRQGRLLLGDPGLYESGWHPLYWRILPEHTGAVCGIRFWKMGNDYLHGSSAYSDRDDLRPGNWVGGSF